MGEDQALQLKKLLGIGLSLHSDSSQDANYFGRSASKSPIENEDSSVHGPTSDNDMQDSDSGNDVQAPSDVPIEESVGWKMLSRMGWKNGQGIGLRGEGRIEPVVANEVAHACKGVGLHHASEFLTLEKPKKRLNEMESWEAGGALDCTLVCTCTVDRRLHSYQPSLSVSHKADQRTPQKIINCCDFFVSQNMNHEEYESYESFFVSQKNMNHGSQFARDGETSRLQ
jgi:hypothetical protein